MIRTVEAIITEGGEVELLEPVKLNVRHRALVTILEEAPAVHGLRPHGLAVGQFTVPDDFDASLPDEVLKEFEG